MVEVKYVVSAYVVKFLFVFSRRPMIPAAFANEGRVNSSMWIFFGHQTTT